MTGLLIHYRGLFFEESRRVMDPSSAVAGMPRGLVGRQVANAEMLQAIIRHGHDETLSFLVHGDREAASLKTILRQHLPGNKKAILKPFETLPGWFAGLGDCVLWEPQPSSAMFAWMRRRYRADRVAIGGVTHALCSAAAIQAIKDLVAAPVTAVDRLVCTSEAVAHTARSLVEHASRFGGHPYDADQIQLETIPLGIDCDRHQPATPQQRREVRQRLGIDEETDVLVFVGRLSHHAKSNPLPLFAGCERASQRTGRKLALILAGWYANDAIRHAFEDEAKRLAPSVPVIHVNAMDPQWRESVWSAADIFVSLADSVQETFGLTVVEAMSRRLAVIATDWNGYRETVKHGETGLLVPTAIVEGAAERSVQAHHEGHLSYDQFLASASQAVRVDTAAVAEAVCQLVASPQRRLALAEAGYRLAREEFAWPKVIARYEELWQRQRTLLRRRAARGLPRFEDQSRNRLVHGHTVSRPEKVVPRFRELFANYPSVWVDPHQDFHSGEKVFGNLSTLSQSPLAHHARQWRVDDSQTDAVVEHVTNRGSQQGHHDEADPAAPNGTPPIDRATEIDTLAWALKYDLIQTPDPITLRDPRRSRATSLAAPSLTLITTCMGRLEHLKQSLPRMVAQTNCHVVVVVDYSCPERTADWVHRGFASESVSVVSVPGRTQYDRSEARNRAWLAARTPWLGFVDADMLLSDNFFDEVDRRLRAGSFLRCAMTTGAMGRGGLMVAARDAVEGVGGYDPVYRGWSEEDEDLVDALIFSGQQLADLPGNVATHIDHDDSQRTEHHETQSLRDRWLINRTYRLAKWDLARQLGHVPSVDQRRHLFGLIEQRIESSDPRQKVIEIKIDYRTGGSLKFQVKFEQAFWYRIERNTEP